jgi:hypothetical protein
MATRIVFAAARDERFLSVDVQEDLKGVFDAWREAPRMPFPLTKSMDSGEKVWINPATVAYFHEVSSGSATST